MNYFTPLSVKDLLKKQKKIQDSVQKGKIYTVFSRSHPVFHIFPINVEIIKDDTTSEKVLGKSKPSLGLKKNTIPSFRIKILNESMDRSVIYD